MRFSKLKAEDVRFAEKFLDRVEGLIWTMTIPLWLFAAFFAYVVIAHLLRG